MVSRHSGWDNIDRNLVEIETDEFILSIKGKPHHSRYESLKQYKRIKRGEEMYFSIDGENVSSVKVFDVEQEALTEKTSVSPIFFENGIYQLVVSPKNKEILEFHHENPSLRKAVSHVGVSPHQVLMGNLTFTNEVGYSTFSIYESNRKLLDVTIEIFPSKLSYKDDYKKLLDEVNEEVYNLAYHFVKKTYLGTTTTLTSEPSWTEFYRLFSEYFHKFIQAIHQIEKQPHHQLNKSYQKVRGDQLRKQDSTGRKYLRKKPHIFQHVKNGISIEGKPMMPTRGINVNKKLSFDTLENRFVKWMMQRTVHKLKSLYSMLVSPKNPYQQFVNEEVNQQVSNMIFKLEKKITSPFWSQISKLDRSVLSLVMQMAPGYREAYQTYLIVSRGLVLQGELYKMSVKDVATLYEYWTFLKLGRMLASKYEMISQDIIQVNREGLFVKLNQSSTAKRVFKHPHTKEKITLHFQKRDRSLPTVPQKPDSMLTIEKKGRDHQYHYVFDAKYRLDFAAQDSYYERVYKAAGPMEEDINTMHRYRDALVVQNNGPYERYAFGAYVLFPWDEEHEYEQHHFYQSINQVNIGGFPFLPNSHSLVERFIDRLIESTPEQLQAQGMLPQGTLEEWRSSLVENVLIVKLDSKEQLEEAIKYGEIRFTKQKLSKGWHEARYLALYQPKHLFEKENGIYQYAKLKNVDVFQKDDKMMVECNVEPWKTLKGPIKPVHYGISHSIVTTLQHLQDADELPELFMKTDEHKQLWKMLRRFTKQVRVNLDQNVIDEASNINTMSAEDESLSFILEGDKVKVNAKGLTKWFLIEDFMNRPHLVFKEIIDFLV